MPQALLQALPDPHRGEGGEGGGGGGGGGRGDSVATSWYQQIWVVAGHIICTAPRAPVRLQ